MRTSILVTIFVLVASRAKVIGAAGYLGCRFSSSVCEEDEVCEEDDLFGQCTRIGIGQSYYYSIDRAGYRLLRQTLSALLTENYTWTDAYTQAILANLLKPYRRISSHSQADFEPLEDVDIGASETSVLTEEQIEHLETLYQQYENLQNQEDLQENYIPEVDSEETVEFNQDSDEESWETLLWKYLDSVLRSQNVDKGTRDRLLSSYFMEYYRVQDEEEKAADEAYTEDKPMNAADDSLKADSEPETNDWDTIQKLQLMRDYLSQLYDQEMAEQGKEALENDFGYQGNGEDDDDLDKKTGNLEGDISVHKYDPGRVVEDDGFNVVVTEDGGNQDFGNIVEDEGSKISVSAENDLQESDIEITSEDIDNFLDSLENPGENLAFLSEEDIQELRDLIKEILAEIEKEAAKDEDSDSKDEKPIFEDPRTVDEDLNLSVDAPVPPLEKKSLQPSSEVPTDEQTPGPVTQATDEEDVVTEGQSDVDEPTLMETSENEMGTEEEPMLVQDLLIDTDYAFVTTAERLTPELGQRLVEELANIIGLPVSTFSNIRVSEYEVSFKVNPNPKNMTASDIDGEAAKHKDDIKDTMGLSITSTGVGDQAHVQVVEHLPSHTPSYVVLTFILTGCVAGILIAVLIIYVLKKQSKQKAKLQNLTSAPPTDQPTTADYQDLCRQRMASKSSEKPEPLHRIGSLGSHYSDAPVPSPSSRSSTSSWSEEPVHPNMDISTGHVVLSYMEDHLKNKDRLAKEWEGLCQYEAEPNSTNAGSDPNNAKKNRYPDILPYDHSRVVLNDSTNADSLDYINANTITDHDPRAPAYIATQGPLPNTVADFWQMVWEQGCMVIVNLTQNMDDKDLVMCHPYWPEEGSQLYHIYEVHLVSEHIWCDDYLVRSFYLKNLQTNETRTVTQFHYLTWPDMGEPSSPKVLLEFRRKVNKSFRGRACPIVVHCSDGSGRTGTYCLIDMVLNRMTKGAKEIDIAATLEHIRDQRMQMVKTRNQFDFALKSVAEEVNAILKALPQ